MRPGVTAVIPNRVGDGKLRRTRAVARGLWDGLVTGWLILKETAPVWLSAFAIVFAVLSLVGGPACVR